MTDELNDNFYGISISPNEDLENLQDEVQNATLEGFSFQPVSENDVILAVCHFKTQARGYDGILQSAIAEGLKFFNASLARGYFRTFGRKLELWLLKGPSPIITSGL